MRDTFHGLQNRCFSTTHPPPSGAQQHVPIAQPVARAPVQSACGHQLYQLFHAEQGTFPATTHPPTPLRGPHGGLIEAKVLTTTDLTCTYQFFVSPAFAGGSQPRFPSSFWDRCFSQGSPFFFYLFAFITTPDFLTTPAMSEELFPYFLFQTDGHDTRHYGLPLREGDHLRVLLCCGRA